MSRLSPGQHTPKPDCPVENRTGGKPAYSLNLKFCDSFVYFKLSFSYEIKFETKVTPNFRLLGVQKKFCSLGCV